VTPTLAISMGDPGGIGPEVLVKALAAGAGAGTRCLVVGARTPVLLAARRAGITPEWRTVAAPEDAPPGPGVTLIDNGAAGDGPFEPGPRARGGSLSHAWVLDAIALARRPAGDPCRAHAIVTGPISKHAWALAGHARHPGHTELLAEAFGVDPAAQDRYGMMFHTPRLRVILATAHVPLARVPAALSPALIEHKITLGDAACRALGVPRPRIAVCGLNPHAGEEGLLGAEDRDLIAPGVARARARGIDASGPHPGDTVFIAAGEGRFDLVVAMYHDQGLIPVKLLDRDRGVNMTVGLPVPRTSPDHGTAFDIAGQNRADPGSTQAAIDLALRLARPGA
jgi:4-hydroxythreonine-4-phosphate dehydrogenase